MLKPDFPKKGMEKEQMKRKKRKKNEKKGKEGFPIKDRKKVKRKRLEENRIIPDQ